MLTMPKPMPQPAAYGQQVSEVSNLAKVNAWKLFQTFLLEAVRGWVCGTGNCRHGQKKLESVQVNTSWTNCSSQQTCLQESMLNGFRKPEIICAAGTKQMSWKVEETKASWSKRSDTDKDYAKVDIPRKSKCNSRSDRKTRMTKVSVKTKDFLFKKQCYRAYLRNKRKERRLFGD